MLAGAVSLAAHGIYQYRVEIPETRRQVGDDIDKLREMLARQGDLQDRDEAHLRQYLRRLHENNIFGTYAHPNSYAGYLVLWLPGLIGAAVVCWRTRAPTWQTILAAGCAVLGGAALWLTHSRGAMLGLVLAGLGVVVLLWRRTLRTHLLVTLAAVLVLVGLGYGAWRSGLLTTAVGKQNNTVALRLQYWSATCRMIRERPWLGVGPGNFGENYTRVMDETAGEKIKDPHNFALEMWATCGLFALLALLGVLASFFLRVVGWLGRAGGVGPLLTPEQGADAPRSPEVRWHFYLGGMFGLLLAFLLRVWDAAPEESCRRRGRRRCAPSSGSRPMACSNGCRGPIAAAPWP